MELLEAWARRREEKGTESKCSVTCSWGEGWSSRYVTTGKAWALTKGIRHQGAFVRHQGLEVPASPGIDVLASTSCVGRSSLILGVGLGGERECVLKRLKFLSCLDIFEPSRAPKA